MNYSKTHDVLGAGLQQLMAGARKFSIDKITRDDVVAMNRETVKVTGLEYIIDANDDVAKNILKG